MGAQFNSISLKGDHDTVKKAFEKEQADDIRQNGERRRQRR